MASFELDHVSLFVRDLDTSARFYAEVLGLPEVENKTGRPHIRWFGLGGGRSIHLISGASEVPANRPLSTHFALATRAFNETLDRLAQHGVTYQDLARVKGKISIRADSARCTFRTRMATGSRSMTGCRRHRVQWANNYQRSARTANGHFACARGEPQWHSSLVHRRGH
jgi:lactoylglutathione lyase